MRGQAYPLNAQTYPLNAWYVAARSVEIAHSLFARKICGKNVVFYRTTTGQPVALEDACWHRLVPLSMGKLKGDDVQCPYHGLVFNSRGRCVHMPSQETINPSAAVRSFPIVERFNFIWIWPGDPALADPRLIPDLHWNDDPHWVGQSGSIHPKCDYRLVLDNLMDLTHATFIHVSTIGSDAIAEAPFDVVYDERSVKVTRWMHNVEAPPFWSPYLKRPGPVDRWMIIYFMAPSAIAIDIGVAPAGTGAPEGDRSQGVGRWVVNGVTPETDTTCHYFWNNVRGFRRDDEGLTAGIFKTVTGLMHEDEVMVEAQQRAISANPGHTFYNLNIDTGGMWVRRIIERMVDDERRGPVLAAAE